MERARLLTLGMGFVSESRASEAVTQRVTVEMKPREDSTVFAAAFANAVAQETTPETAPEEAAPQELSCVTIMFTASENACPGVLDGMVSQVLEAGLAEQEFHSRFETSLVRDGDEATFCVKIYLGIDAFQKAHPHPTLPCM